MSDPRTFPDHTRHEVPLAGGSSILVRDFGPAGAPVVLYHHGTPSCSLDVPAGWHGGPEGVRVVTFDRPGYAESSNLVGRRVADAGEWSERIADELGVGRFALMGTSGGGPHAAAAAAVLKDRITRLCVSVGLGPVGMPGFEWEVGMPADTVEEMRRAERGEADLRAFIDEMMAKDDPLGDWMSLVPPSDREVLARPEVAAEEEAVIDAALAAGIEGWLEDDLAFSHRDWGAALETITAETLLLYGGADAFVPHHHGDALRDAIGHGELVKVPHLGHYMRDVEPAVLRWLAAPAATPFELPAAIAEVSA